MGGVYPIEASRRRAGRPVQAYIQAILGMTTEKRLVVGRRGPQLLGGVQGGGGHHAAVGLLPKTRDGFVDGVVAFHVLALPVRAPLPPVVEPDERDPAIVPRAFANHEGIALHAAGVINQGRGGRPQRIVEHGVV